MDLVRKYWLVAVAFIVGLVIGLFFAWVVWPVEWTDATPAQLSEPYQEAYVKMTAELFSLNGNDEMVRQALGGWGGDTLACELAASSPDSAEQARLQAVAAVTNGVGCTGAPVDTGEEEGGGSSTTWLIIFGLLFALALIVILIFFVLKRRSEVVDQPQRQETSYEEVPGSAPTAIAEPEEDVTAIPIARFHTTYSRGHDAYDDSFSIENSNAEFLGECGVGIAESIGADLPKNVTALEIWLFDKSDIRTITKVVMSDYAFFEEALKAKLAPKGDPVLARETETIVLETASLIINAEITEMAYGVDNALPPKSSFDRITISLSVWSKEGAAETEALETPLDDDNLLEM
jgi:heme/copper-type cytochrome/quinol oxidase subunit 2